MGLYTCVMEPHVCNPPISDEVAEFIASQVEVSGLSTDAEVLVVSLPDHMDVVGVEEVASRISVALGLPAILVRGYAVEALDEDDMLELGWVRVSDC